MRTWSRRGFLTAAAAATAGAAVGCAPESSAPTPVLPGDPSVAAAERARRLDGAAVVAAAMTAAPATVDLGGGLAVATWAYDGRVPGKEIRLKAGQVLSATVTNGLPVDTTLHWHGLAVRNDADGVPHLTQDPIAPGGSRVFEFTVPDAGTHWFHPHVGVQLDRGLYAPLIVEDPADLGRQDAEAVLVLDDWLDGVDGRDPDAELATLLKGMEMDHGMAMFPSPVLGGDAGDVAHPHFLINGRTIAEPHVVTAGPGQRVLLRLINAGADTAFRFAVAGHRLTVIATDGYPVVPVETSSLLIGMGERYDVLLTAGDGAFPIVAAAEGKGARAAALLRTASGAADVTAGVPELLGTPLLGIDLTTPPERLLPARPADVTHDVVLAGDMATYDWTINGRLHPDVPPFEVREGQRARFRVQNASAMFHPVHLHGHTFQTGSLRKDTLLVLPGQKAEFEMRADNPGQWMLHCHNAYHGEAGMMATVSYVK
ncbi:putative oxidase [Actinorhabdospora filicis]|uniref:Oxidase n=1 Tax=Actinorhabdospora filicis TaxID=1785913 RepID=A0A9W6WCR9_9ACTN|nr:multicopper oxidase family protein [Actinorhabdospora filicis]GLZ81904.1 putative oxidase [Actinorhabdospora filicis]